MWKQDKIDHKRNYFYKQRIDKTGNFTEFVVRTYYCILKNSRDRYCLADSVNSNKIKYEIYDGIYPEPDHAAAAVIDDCKNNLEQMGYIHYETKGAQKYIVVDKPLDFLLEGEHERYMNNSSLGDSGSDIQISLEAIDTPEEMQLILNHMADPKNYPDINESIDRRKKERCKQTKVHCGQCADGYYQLRKGPYGQFFGCNNYPKCKSTKKVDQITYSLILQNGINIYEMPTHCWKCGKDIKIRSYFPQIDFAMIDPDFLKLEPLGIIRLSMIDSFDDYLSQKYENIYVKDSQKAGFAYMANNCPYCGSLQGSQMALSKMYEWLLEKLESESIGDCIVDKLEIEDTPSTKDAWKELISVVMQRNK